MATATYPTRLFDHNNIIAEQDGATFKVYRITDELDEAGFRRWTLKFQAANKEEALNWARYYARVEPGVIFEMGNIIVQREEHAFKVYRVVDGSWVMLKCAGELTTTEAEILVYAKERVIEELQAEIVVLRQPAPVALGEFIPYSSEVLHAAPDEEPGYLYTYWLVEQKRFPDGAEWVSGEPVPTPSDALAWGCKAGETVKVWGVPASARGNEVREMTGNNIVAEYRWKGQRAGGWEKVWFPKTGDGCSLQSGSDYYPYTVSRVSESGKTFWMRPDHALRVDNNGISERQEYRFEQCPHAEEIRVTLRKDGSWIRQGHAVGRITYGRRAYLDPSF